MVGGKVVNATSTTQHCVALSTSDAEFVAIVQGMKRSLFARVMSDFL